MPRWLAPIVVWAPVVAFVTVMVQGILGKTTRNEPPDPEDTQTSPLVESPDEDEDGADE